MARALSRYSPCACRPGPPHRHINQVAGLDTVTVTEDAVRVGATVRHRDVERSDEAYAALPLRQALLNVAHPAIRNRGTTVGRIAHADAGEMPSIAVLTDAIVEVQGQQARETRA